MPMMIGAALVGVFVTLVLFAIVLAVGPRRPALRHRILVLGSAVLILGPLISVVIPAGWFPAWLKIDVPSIELRESGDPELRKDSAVTERGNTSADSRLLAPNDSATTMPERVVERSFLPLLGIVWLAGVIIGLLHLLDSLRSLRRLSRWSSEADELLVHDCRKVCASLSIAPVRLLTSAEIDIPMTWGLISPRILVPVDAATWSASRRTAVLLHESAHICRRDSFAQWMLRLSCMFFWWNPLVWCLSRIAHRDAELACDARVLETGFSPRAYAEELVSLAQGLSGTMQQFDLASSGGNLVARVEAMTWSPRPPATIGKSAARAISASAALAILSSVVLVSSFSGDSEPDFRAERVAPNGAQHSAAATDTSTAAESPASFAVNLPRDEGTPDLRSSADSLHENETKQSARIRGSDATEAFILDLADESAHVRETAAAALGRTKSTSALHPLIHVLESDSSPQVRETAADALGRLRQPEAVNALAAALQDPSKNVRLSSAGALGRIGTSAVVEPLLGAALDPSDHVREAAVDALGRVPDEIRVRSALLRALDDPNSFVRRSAEESLARIGSSPS